MYISLLLEMCMYHTLGYEKVYLPLYKVTYTPFHIQGDDIHFPAR